MHIFPWKNGIFWYKERTLDFKNLCNFMNKILLRRNSDVYVNIYILYSDRFSYQLTPVLRISQEDLNDRGLYDFVYDYYSQWVRDHNNNNYDLDIRMDKIVGIMFIHKRI